MVSQDLPIGLNPQRRTVQKSGGRAYAGLVLLGRESECALLERLLEHGRAGRSGVLVVRGEPGIGKTALLAAARSSATGYRLLQAVGVQSEADLPFAAVHQLLHPVMDRLVALPDGQRRALEGAFGLGGEVVQNRFLISLAVLTVLAEVAEEGPVLCMIDDAHWLDTASAEALTFAARRLEAESVVMVFATRSGEAHSFSAHGLTELTLAGLAQDAARRLVEESAPGVARHVRDALVEGSAGNPLGLRELPRSLSVEQPRGPQRCPSLCQPMPRWRPCSWLGSGAARRGAGDHVLAAAAHSDDLGAITRAAAVLGLDEDALDQAERTGLILVSGGLVTFDHPLVRAAVYRGATFAQRQAAHRALADSLRAEEPDRAAWHSAAAATGPDEPAAAGLEHAGQQAERRGGHGAASVAYQQAAGLSPLHQDRARRYAAAGVAAWRAGQLERARSLLAEADAYPAGPGNAAEVAQLRGTLEFLCGSTRAAYGILMDAARRVPAIDRSQMAGLLGEAAQIAWTSGDLDELARAAEMLRGLPDLAGRDAVLSMVAQAIDAYLSQDYAAAAGFFDQAIRNSHGLADLQAGTMAAAAHLALGDDAAGIAGFERTVAAARAAGAIEVVPSVLALLASCERDVGRFGAAAMSATEGLRLATDTGQDIIAARLASTLAWLAAVQGRPEECRDLADGVMTERPGHRPWPPAIAFVTWALALVDLGAGRNAEACTALEGLAHGGQDLGHRVVAISSAADLVEAAVRIGRVEVARQGLQTLDAWARPTRALWGQALVCRCLALLDDGEGAEHQYAEALRLHAGAGRAFEAARTSLLFGEWLRRRRRRTDSRVHLRRACAEFERMGARPWADRANAELRATGETAARRRDPSSADRLTPQELQIALAVGRGATNREVAAQLFLSPRTVDYHLHKVFAKLAVASRAELIRLSLQGDGLDPAGRQPS